MIHGYARVSTTDQDATLQHNALTEAGCERLYTDQASGGRWDRPELHKLLDGLREGDVVVVWKLDRLSRSLKDLLVLLERINDIGAGFKSITEAIDTTTAAGRMMTQMLGAFAEFERQMIRERTNAGLKAAQAKGRVGGRPPKLTPQQKTAVIKMLNDGTRQADIARLFNVHPATISRLVAQNRQRRVGSPSPTRQD